MARMNRRNTGIGERAVLLVLLLGVGISSGCNKRAPYYDGQHASLLVPTKVERSAHGPGFVLQCTVTNTTDEPIYYIAHESGRPLVFPYVQIEGQWEATENGICGVGLQSWTLPPGKSIDTTAYSSSLDERRIGFVYRTNPDGRDYTVELADVPSDS